MKNLLLLRSPKYEFIVFKLTRISRFSRRWCPNKSAVETPFEKLADETIYVSVRAERHPARGRERPWGIKDWVFLVSQLEDP